MEPSLPLKRKPSGSLGLGHGSGSTAVSFSLSIYQGIKLSSGVTYRVRFRQPYIYTLEAPSLAGQQLTIQQKPFSHEGFASTVWDSSIVMAKYFEVHAGELRGKRCLDLSAGCGLVGLVMGKLGAEVVASDLQPNLALLKDNMLSNGMSFDVLEHSWGEDASSFRGPFDVLVACDVMYIEDLVQPLLTSLHTLSHETSEVYLAHGRNRQAEGAFLKASSGRFSYMDVPGEQLHDVYQCSDVRVLKLSRLAHASSA